MDRLLSIGEGRQIRKLEAVAKQVNLIEPDFEKMTDAELRGQTADFKKRYEDGATLDELMPEAFATVREATKRVMGKRHFDVQIMGGAALHWCNIAEMKTGEGKTLVGVLPSYLNALTGRGVHVVTVNDYLAKFQSEQMGRIHHFLGMEVGAILTSMTPAERREAYNKDITYGTNNEFGFDYLRDNMAHTIEDCVQRDHYFAIVDEVDSILVDEARTPLIISGPAEDDHNWYPIFARMVKRMTRAEPIPGQPGEFTYGHYEVDEKKKTVSVLEAGITYVEDRLDIDNLYESVNTPLISLLNNAIKARELFKRDRDYVIIDGEVLIVDEHTGRTLIGRRYNEGLHQALEAKEGVQIKDEYQTLATITLQNYFRMYDKLAGMTGTAKTEEGEFQKIYGLGVLPIPTNKPMIRDDRSDLIYQSESAKFDAIVEDITSRHREGQPLLLGTASVAKSELLSKRLVKAGIAHEVLNAKNHEREAAIVALAGRKGAVTVATNMAGRGTDIILGGNVEFLADARLREQGLDPVEHPDEYEAAWPKALAELEEQVAKEHEEVVGLGGLCVIGTERHESRRIDNQLRGRSGRQGDPGESRFYLSLEDDLMRLFKSDVIAWVMQVLKVPEDVPIEDKRVSKAVQSAQEQVEAQNFEIRKNVLKYDDVMNRQRHAIYGDRRRVLEGTDVEAQLRSAVDRVVEQYVRGGTEGFEEDWDLEQLWTNLNTLYPVTLKLADYNGKTTVTQDELVADFLADAQAAYDRREAEFGSDVMRQLERYVLLTVLDRKWREHLYEMDYLREGIGLRAMAQRDPLVEYQREGGQMFNTMMEAFMEEVVGFLFHSQVQVPEQPQVGLQAGGLQTAAELLSGPGDPDVGPESVIDPPEDPGAAALAATRPQGRKAAKRAAHQSKAEAADVPAAPVEKGTFGPPKAKALTYSGPSESGEAVKTGATKGKVVEEKVGRNDPCPCGSGKKYKLCHGAK